MALPNISSPVKAGGGPVHFRYSMENLHVVEEVYNVFVNKYTANLLWNVLFWATSDPEIRSSRKVHNVALCFSARPNFWFRINDRRVVLLYCAQFRTFEVLHVSLYSCHLSIHILIPLPTGGVLDVRKGDRGPTIAYVFVLRRSIHYRSTVQIKSIRPNPSHSASESQFFDLV